MSKSELIDKLAADVSLPKTKVKEVVDAFVKAINDGLAASGKVTLSGLGNFTKTTRKARSGRNPKTGETIQIPEKVGVKFKAASQLTESLN
jgi:DNA-binding protein HU-beta